MNKQQLASTIWQSANQMRSKIEANEYKDYILGFMFYKYLSDREISFLKGEKYSDEDIKKVTADDEKLVKHISENIGYFIAYEDLFSSWLSKGDDFDVSDVRDALSNFDANIEPTYKKLFENIFKTLQSGLSKLGETSTKQTKSIKALLKLIKRIPMDGKQDYDVLGFIYEYLISMFAANAGKKAGEFYTPHEVSVLMSEIVANHLKDREHIKIYDPTSGSGSLLINIGASMAQYIEGENKIDYYAQELKENTYNLTRMNLVMRGINPANINVRNGDTLEDDWPFFETDENNPINEWYTFIKKFLSIPMAHMLIGFYTIADTDEGILKVMRSYQYYAAVGIANIVAEKKSHWDDKKQLGGHVWHTTGSGKTMTSFKAAQLVAANHDADKVVFLVDRKELGIQSLKEYRSFATGTESVQATENTDVLISKLKSPDSDNTLIVTSIQKLSNIAREDVANIGADLKIIQRKRMVIIIDECHRSTFGDMLVDKKIRSKMH